MADRDLKTLEFSAKQAFKELIRIEKSKPPQLKIKSAISDRLRLLNNSLDVYFSNIKDYSIHEKMKISLLKQLSDLSYFVGSEDHKDGLFKLAPSEKDNFVSLIWSIENYIKERINITEQKERVQDDERLKQVSGISRSTAFQFQETSKGFDRTDKIDDMSKSLFAIIFGEMIQLLKEIDSDIAILHNYFPNTFTLVCKYKSELKDFENFSTIKMWSLGMQLDSVFKKESVKCDSDLSRITASVEAFQGLNGALINCFSEGKAVLDAADRYRTLNIGFDATERDALSKIISMFAIHGNELVTERVKSEAIMIKTSPIEKVETVGRSVIGREFAVGLITAISYFIMKSAVSGSIGNAAYDSAKLAAASVNFIESNSELIKIIIADLPNSTRWIQYLYERYAPQLKFVIDKKINQ